MLAAPATLNLPTQSKATNGAQANFERQQFAPTGQPTGVQEVEFPGIHIGTGGGKRKRRRLHMRSPWKLVAGISVLFFSCTWPILLMLLVGESWNDMLQGFVISVVVTVIVALGFIVAAFEVPGITWAYVILLTGILPGIVILTGWCAAMEGLGYEFHPWRGHD